MANIVILAAGKGTRMKSSKPKVLHSIGAVPMLHRVIQAAQKAGATNSVVVVGHGADLVKQSLAGHQSLQFAVQSQQLGTGHAVQVAQPLLHDSEVTLILYGDVPLIKAESLKPMISAAQAGKLALMTLITENPDGYGRILRNSSDEIIGIIEQKDASPEQLEIQEVNTGILACPTPLLKQCLSKLTNDNAQREYYLTDVIALASSMGCEVEALQPDNDSEVVGVNSRVQQAELERVFQKEQALELMEAGLQLADPARFDLRGTLRCGTDVFIDINCVIEGEVVLGSDVSVGPNCVLKDVKIADGAQINAFCHLEGALVGQSAIIGPYARLRPGANLGEEVHVGNFVEVKKASLGKGSKANHLAYLGDAVIGKGVNIGAGTITCNYDGANKHLTEIEDDVFVGSDTQLVAPVKVGKGATLGAGTTLTKDAPAESLTVSRAKQITIQGWKRPTKNK